MHLSALAVLACLTVVLPAGRALAQDAKPAEGAAQGKQDKAAPPGEKKEGAEEKKKRKWTNSTNFSVVATEGNSNSETLGFTNVATRQWKGALARIKLDAVRSDTADDPFLLVAPGLTFEPGETVTGPFDTLVVRPPTEPDIEKYFAEARYERDFVRREHLTWNAGASWDRNEDAGILNRFIVFLGFGHAWYAKEFFKFKTAYALSLTDREEDEPDPEKDPRFAGFRFSWDFLDQWGKVTIFENDFTGNINLSDLADQSFDMTNAISVKLSKILALKVSLQGLYNSEPALEDVDVVARVVVVDPDGVPGNGDEFFETVTEGGAEITIGEASIRKKELDVTFRTSLVINF
jgi:hypothetical protein